MKTLTIADTARHLCMSPAQVRKFIKDDNTFPVIIYNERNFKVDAVGLNKWMLIKKQRTPQMREAIKAKAERAKAEREAKKAANS